MLSSLSFHDERHALYLLCLLFGIHNQTHFHCQYRSTERQIAWLDNLSTARGLKAEALFEEVYSGRTGTGGSTHTRARVTLRRPRSM